MCTRGSCKTLEEKSLLVITLVRLLIIHDRLMYVTSFFSTTYYVNWDWHQAPYPIPNGGQQLRHASGRCPHQNHPLHVWKWSKNNKIPNEQPAFRCQPAFGSHSQSLTNKLFSLFFFMRPTWASRAHDEKGTFFIIFRCFLSFSTIRMHAQACIGWSKYTTIDFLARVKMQYSRK